MEDIIKKQTVLGGFISRMWVNLQKLGQAKITPTEINTRTERLNEYWRQFQDQHFLVIVKPEADKTEYVRRDYFTTIEESYFEVRHKFAEALADLTPTRATGQSAHDRTHDSSFGDEASVFKQMQLPKITLPKFSGDQLAWEGFRDLFRSLVHDVSTISKVQKLQYLKSSLTGEAAHVVDSVPLTDAAYQGAWEDLLARYDNPRILLYAHMRNLLSCPAASAKASPAEIKRLLGVTLRSLRAFKSLKRPVDHWDDWVVHLLVSKLDAATRVHWETSLADSRVFPTFKELQRYLENRIRALEAANPESILSRSTPAVVESSRKPTRVSSNAATTSKPKADKGCSMCKANHLLPYCSKFKALAVEQRGEHIWKTGLCSNCLRSGHGTDSCQHTGRCLVCGGKHHTVVHGGCRSGSRADDGKRSKAETTSDLSTSVLALAMNTGRTMLLSTAEVLLQGPTGETLTVRALLDSGSEVSFVTESVVQSLRLKRRSVDVVVAGLQGTRTGSVSSSVRVALRSRLSPASEIAVDAFVLRTLTNLIPSRHVSGCSWPHIQGLQLADPRFDVPSRIDVILGADVYGQVLQPDVRHGEPGSPTAQLTSLGWVLLGTLSTRSGGTVNSQLSVHHVQARDALAAVLQQFWELENVGADKPLSPEEEQAEQHFVSTHSRDADGRYVVRLPRRTGPTRLGASRPAALSMLLSSERRQARQPELRRKYNDFLTEYLALDHMEIVPRGHAAPSEAYYMPHHAVFKASDPASKIRVVFNASARTTSTYSLNDCLLPGPRLQADLWLVIT
ncbi:uncharacterized protein LOC114945904 [Nylanderia fulva]|uniref:uncharacterized protein LOC114945904 n=1 Tax=Nylanderia fulva TaxID=613905 RepID=UPI0010FB2E5E|nr:uncharacterized protein LOC114945904 [Nylanderia fulva]